MLRFTCFFIGITTTAGELAAQAPNDWVKLDKAVVAGRRWDVPVGYAPELRRFIILGGRSSFADYRKPRSFDVLTLQPESNEWENDYPAGKNWGPRVGPCQAPAWNDEKFGFKDIEGNVRPNWTIYGTFSLGQKYDYDPDTKAFYFYAGGSTFKYEPELRKWTDLQPATHPEKELGGTLLWSSLVYDRHPKQWVLFGGGNIQSERGDPGTWTYAPAKNRWTPLRLQKQPPQRANARLAYDPQAKRIVLFGGDQLDQLLSDTWTFDVVKQQWDDVKPSLAPAPRGGHALLWLPKAKKILLVGGYTYTSTTDYVASLYQRLPLELWTYDTIANRWDLLKRLGPKQGPDAPANFFCSAAVDEQDRLLVQGQSGTWMCQVDAAKIDAGRGYCWRSAYRLPPQNAASVRTIRRGTTKGAAGRFRAGRGGLEGAPRESLGAATDAEIAGHEHGLGLGGLRARMRLDPAFLRRPLRIQRDRSAGLRRQDRSLQHPVRPGVSARIRLLQRSGARRMELQAEPVDDRPHLQVPPAMIRTCNASFSHRTTIRISSIRRLPYGRAAPSAIRISRISTS